MIPFLAEKNEKENRGKISEVADNFFFLGEKKVERSESEDFGDIQRLISSWKGVDALVSSGNWLTSTLLHWVEEGSDDVYVMKRVEPNADT